MQYHFLILSLILLIPGTIIYILRRDLRITIHRMAVLSLPFAFTEFLFYPNYWEPKFLFDSVYYIGFGIEDIIFVVGLASFTSTSYCFFGKRAFEPIDSVPNRVLVKRIIFFFLIIGILVTIFYVAKVEMIFGSFFIMMGLGTLVLIFRKDLLIPMILGGIISLILYTAICGILLVLFPNVFLFTWKTENFLNLFVFGIPVEELMYGFASGYSATILYPYLWNLRIVRFHRHE